jgi:hypothetical protein
MSASRPAPGSPHSGTTALSAGQESPTINPRQRWRLYLRLPAVDLPGELPAGAGAWAAILERGGLPLVPEPGRGRVVLAAQLPLRIAGEREIIDLVLSTRLPLAEVRARVRASLPSPVALVDLHDVWVGAPSAAAALVAADYRVEVAGVSPRSLEEATEAIMAARALSRERRREKKTQLFDLRPLVLTLSVEPAPGAGGGGVDGPTAVLRARLRHRPNAVGRPEDVVAALAVPPAPPLDGDIRVLNITRECLFTLDDA